MGTLCPCFYFLFFFNLIWGFFYHFLLIETCPKVMIVNYSLVFICYGLWICWLHMSKELYVTHKNMHQIAEIRIR